MTEAQHTPDDVTEAAHGLIIGVKIADPFRQTRECPGCDRLVYVGDGNGYSHAKSCAKLREIASAVLRDGYHLGTEPARPAATITAAEVTAAYMEMRRGFFTKEELQGARCLAARLGVTIEAHPVEPLAVLASPTVGVVTCAKCQRSTTIGQPHDCPARDPQC